jgi:4-hydroxy-3-polyprenylbenzoate decarboxylase
MYRNLQAFIADLEQTGELVTIDRRISPVIEISRRIDEESKKSGGGKALLFNRVEGSPYPVAANLYGSDRRICMALGVSKLDQLGRRMAGYVDFEPPRSLRDTVSMLPMALDLFKFFPRPFRGWRPPCQEVVQRGDQVDLSRLPVIQCWPKDGGRFITLPLVFTRSLESGKRNLGMYRLQVYDRCTTGMHWHIHKDGAHFYGEYARAGRRMPVAVAIGADPATVYAATAPMPLGMDELLLAGFIRKKPVRLVKCLTSDLRVPAEAEFVLEGYVEPGELRREGPFGDHTGYYSLADDYPVFHLTALTHRRRPVYNTTLVGRPPMEDCYLAKATERLFLPLLRTVMPEVHDYWLPWEGVFHNAVVAAIDKAYAGHAQKVMYGMWGQGQMSFCKSVCVVDAAVDVQEPAAVLRMLVSNLDLATDVTLTKGVLDVLDHTSPSPNFGYKIGIDLTTRTGAEPARQRPVLGRKPFEDQTIQALMQAVAGVSDARELLAEVTRADDARLRICGVCVKKRAQRGGHHFTEKLLLSDPLSDFNVIVLFDDGIDLTDGSLLWWRLFNNVDPGRDLYWQGARVAIDACKKGPADGHLREWPEDLTFDV